MFNSMAWPYTSYDDEMAKMTITMALAPRVQAVMLEEKVNFLFRSRVRGENRTEKMREAI